MAICPYLTQMIMTQMDYNGDTNNYWPDSGTPTNDVKWAVCNGDGTVTLHGETQTCELWDSTNNKCGTKVTNTLVDSPNNETNILITLLEDVLGKHSEKQNAVTGESVVTLWNHFHDSHKHSARHNYDDIPDGAGKPVDDPYAPLLVTEFMSNEDKDNNGKIFGKDFKVEDTDQKPSVLDAVEQNPNWQEPSTTVKWSELLAWYQDPNNNADPLA